MRKLVDTEDGVSPLKGSDSIDSALMDVAAESFARLRFVGDSSSPSEAEEGRVLLFRGVDLVALFAPLPVARAAWLWDEEMPKCALASLRILTRRSVIARAVGTSP